jgi:hypothetical protein
MTMNNSKPSSSGILTNALKPDSPLNTNSVPLAFLLGSLIITLIRIQLPIPISSDLTAQVQATLNLLSGDGFGRQELFETAQKGLEVAIVPLTHFPPGLSLFLLGMLKTGMPLATSLKFIYSIATLSGWLLWGFVFQTVIFNGYAGTRLFKRLIITLLVIIGLFFPGVYTLPWNGTDLLLWSLIPALVLIALLISKVDNSNQSAMLLSLGMVVGLLYAIRYASIFLVPGLILFAALEKISIRKILLLLPGFLGFYISIAIYKQSIANSAFGYWKFSLASLLDLTLITEKIRLVQSSLIPFLVNLGSLLFGPHFLWKTSDKWPILLTLLCFVSASLVLAALYRSNQKLLTCGQDLISVMHISIGLISGLLLVLFTSFFISSTNQFLFISDPRFYLPLYPLLLLLCFKIFESTPTLIKATPQWSEQIGSDRIAYRSGFIISLTCILVALSFAFHSTKIIGTDLVALNHPISRFTKASKRESVQGFAPRDPQSVKALTDFMSKNKDVVALNFAEDFDFSFTLDPQIRRRFVSGTPKLKLWPRPITIRHNQTVANRFYFVFRTEENCPSYCYNDSGIEVAFFKPTPDFKLVYANSTERIKIFEAQLPSLPEPLRE